MKTLIVVSVIVVSSIACAQTSKLSGFGVNAGVGYPTHQSVKDMKKSGFNFGFTYEVPNCPVAKSMGEGAKGTAFLDFARVAGNGNKSETWGLGMQWSRLLSTGSTAVSGGIGLGLFNVHAAIAPAPGGGGSGNALSAGESSTTWRLGGKAFVTLPLSQGLSLTASYNLIGARDGINPSNFGVSLGYKF